MLRENAEFSMHKWHQILLLSALFTAVVFCYLVVQLVMTKQNGICSDITIVLFDRIHAVVNGQQQSYMIEGQLCVL